MKTFKISQNLYEELSEEEMIERYTPLIKNKAFKWHEYYSTIAFEHVQKLDREDFEQIGYLAIIESYRSYDIGYDILYYTHLLNKIDNSMKRFIRDTLKLRREEFSLIGKRISSIDESFSLKDNGNKEISLGETISYEENRFEELEDKIVLDNLLKELNEQEKNIVNSYYINNMTQVQIADKYNISQVQVSRILKRSIMKLSNRFNKERKEEDSMGKLNEQQLKNYLIRNADKDTPISRVIKNYCSKYVIPESTVFTALNKRMSDFYEEVKGFYKPAKREEFSNRISFDIERAKELIENKVMNEHYSLTKSITECSKEIGVSASTIRKHLIDADKAFMDKLKTRSLANGYNYRYSIDTVTNNIMPTNISKLDPFNDKKDPIDGVGTDTVSRVNNSVETVPNNILKDLNNVCIYFKGNHLKYTVTEKGIMILRKDTPLMDKSLDIKEVEEIIKDLQKTIEISKTLF